MHFFRIQIKKKVVTRIVNVCCFFFEENCFKKKLALIKKNLLFFQIIFGIETISFQNSNNFQQKKFQLSKKKTNAEN